MVNLTIDGVQVAAQEGATILAAAQAAGIEIPSLCFMKELKPYGACGLWVVEVEKCPKLLRACATKVAEGMVVNTKGERAMKARRLAMELLMGDHDGDCQGPCKLNCPAHTDCQKYVKEIAEGRFADATATVMETFPIPASIGRVCPHPCEKHCRRSLVEQPISIAAEWVNKGVAPCLPDGFVAWSLCDAAGNVCWSFTDETFDVRALEPTLEDGPKPVKRVSRGRFGNTAAIPPWNDMVLDGLRKSGRVTETSFDMLAPGEYALCVSVGSRQGTPKIALPIVGGKCRRYPLGRVTVVRQPQ